MTAIAIYNFMAIIFNPFTGNFDFTSTAASDISGGLDNLLLTNGDHLLLTSHATDDVLLLT